MTQYDIWNWTIWDNELGNIYESIYSCVILNSKSLDEYFNTKDSMNCLWMKFFDPNEDYITGYGLEVFLKNVHMQFYFSTNNYFECIKVI